MSTNPKTPTLIYSQHFRCMARLLQNSTRNEIFTYLLDEHVLQLRRGKANPTIAVSYSEIAEKSGVSRNVVASHLKSLEALHLINLWGNSCNVDANFLVAIVSLFNQQKSYDGSQKVREAFLSGDIDQLKELGFQLTETGNSELKTLKGTLEDCTDLCTTPKYEQSNAQICATDMLKSVQLPDFINQIKANFASKIDFYDAIRTLINTPNAQICASKFIDAIFDAQICANSQKQLEIVPLALRLLAEIIASNVHRSVQPDAQMCATDCTDLCNRNKEKENNKRKTQGEALVKKDEIEQEEIEEVEVEEGVAEGERFFSGFGKPLEIIELQPQPIREHSGITSRRERPSYPLLPVEEINRIINDVEYAASSPLRLFINTVWWVLTDYLQDVVEPEDEDNCDDEEPPVMYNIEGNTYRAEDFQKEILEVAYDEVLGHMEVGCIETDDRRTIPVNFTEMFPKELLGEIFKWKKEALSRNEMVYIISKNGIHDISAEKVEKAIQPQTREERRIAMRDSFQYMTKLYVIRRDKLPELSQLTPIEELAAECIERYLRPEDNGTGYYHFKINCDSQYISAEGTISKNAWRMLKMEVEKKGYTEQDFLSCLLSVKGPNQYEQLPIQPCMFFAQGIRALNLLYNRESVVDGLVVHLDPESPTELK